MKTARQWVAMIVCIALIGGASAETEECGTFDIELLRSDIKTGYFDDNNELAKATMRLLAWHLECECGPSRRDRAMLEKASDTSARSVSRYLK